MNSVNVGIETCACLIFTDNVRISSKLQDFASAIRRYKLDAKGRPVKEQDDEADAFRYAVYSSVYDRLIDFSLKPKLAEAQEG